MLPILYQYKVTLKSSEMPLSSTVFEFLPVVKQVRVIIAKLRIFTAIIYIVKS